MPVKKRIFWNQCGMWPGKGTRTTDMIYKRFLQPLSDHFEFVVSDKPQYLFVSDFNGLKFLKKGENLIRIYYTNENFHPNFHLFDYAMGYNHGVSFGDRFSFILSALFSIEDEFEATGEYPFSKNRILTSEDLRKRSVFCDFIYNVDHTGRRKELFNLLNSYKRVDAIGPLFNNSGEKIKLNYDYKRKLEFQKKSKFSIVVESSLRSEGLITEKIFHALYSGTIPVYWGEDSVKEIINPKRIINVKDYSCMEDLLQRVKEIDQNDDLYLDIVNEPCFVEENFFGHMREKTDSFLYNIFDQDFEQAKRRPLTELFYSTRYNKIMKFFSGNLIWKNKFINKFINLTSK